MATRPRPCATSPSGPRCHSPISSRSCSPSREPASCAPSGGSAAAMCWPACPPISRWPRSSRPSTAPSPPATSVSPTPTGRVTTRANASCWPCGPTSARPCAPTCSRSAWPTWWPGPGATWPPRSAERTVPSHLLLVLPVPHRLVGLPVPHLQNRCVMLPAQHTDRTGTEIEQSAPHRRQLEPPGGEHPQDVPVGHAEGVSKGLPSPLDDPIGPAPHIGGPLPLRHAVVPQRPPRTSDLDLGGGQPLIRAVVPLEKVRLDLSVEPRQGARVPGPLQRARQDLGERQAA